MDYHLLQRHTVDIYDLEHHEARIMRVPARSLLKPQRFDLFAKLFYIRNKDNDPHKAQKIYAEHIKAFNPDGKEPGREDKNGVNDFITAFDAIIADFSVHEFDDQVSVVPVDKNGVILDGGHRVSALAFYDREVTIAQYDDVVSKCDFDYQYFMDRGLSWNVCDTIAWEMTQWCDNYLVACLWPRLGGEKEKSAAVNELAKNHSIAYVKKVNVNMKSLCSFVAEIYKMQAWTTNPHAVRDKAMRIYGNRNRSAWFVFFDNAFSLDDVLAEKERLRDHFGYAKDSLHITDNIEETRQIASLTLTADGLSTWLTGAKSGLVLAMSEKWHYFKKVTWTNAKSRVWNLLHRR